MQNPILYFEQSPGFLLLCLLAGAIYTALMYQKKGPWGRGIHYLLAGLRFVTVTLLSALLLGPFLKQIKYTREAPSIVFAIDNSQSIKEMTDSTVLESLQTSMIGTARSLMEKGFKTEFRVMDNPRPISAENIQFEAEKTNLEQGLQHIQNDYEGRNLSQVVLISDGIFNRGMSPAFKTYHFEVQTLGLGDTVPQSDISIRNLLYNKISYQGNRFPLVAEIINKGFKGRKVSVEIKDKGRTLASKTLTFKEDNQVNTLEFHIEATQKGLQRYEVTVQALPGEFTNDNNTKQAYVDIVEGKERILLVAPAPHPDIKALTATLETNANYELDLYIPGIHALPEGKTPYDLVIFHQSPDKKGATRALFQEHRKKGTPYLLLMGEQSDLNLLNGIDDVLNLRAFQQERDKVNGMFNPNFNNFSLSEELQTFLEEFPPLSVPFGRPIPVGNTQVLLYQKVGSLLTQKPLLALRSESPKRAIMLGDGIWRWRLHEYARKGNHQGFDELFTKLVQFLSSKEDKRKFKAYPLQNEFSTSESIIFDTEVYNDLYEQVYGHKVDLHIHNDQGEAKHYSFITHENNTQYRINDLPEGVYDYEASTVINTKKERIQGQFVVKKLSIESLNLTADFDLLRSLSRNTGGEFHTPGQWPALSERLQNSEAKSILHHTERYLPLINLKILFFLLLLLIGAEWFLRKFNGTY